MSLSLVFKRTGATFHAWIRRRLLCKHIVSHGDPRLNALLWDSQAFVPVDGSADPSLMNQDRRSRLDREALELVEMRTLEVQMNAMKKRLQVSRELDSLKRRGGDIETAARLATKWLLRAIQAGQSSGSLRAQGKGEHAANVPQYNADDAVLACAAYFHNLCAHHAEGFAGPTPQAILITDDVGLKLKASMLEIRAQSTGELLAGLCGCGK